MTDLTADSFNEICGSGPVKTELDASEAAFAQARKISRNRWLIGLGATLVALVVSFAAFPVAVFPVLIGGPIVTWIWASGALSKQVQDLKEKVLPHLAQRAGLTYDRVGFDPKGYARARPSLFGWVDQYVASEMDGDGGVVRFRRGGRGGRNRGGFSDQFMGTVHGREAAFYDATLTRTTGYGKNRNTQIVFTGQMYWMRRRNAGQGETVIVPDKGLFNFFKPSGGFERVKFENDAEFEKRFEVYSTVPAEAEVALGSSELRAKMLELRGKGRMFAYIGTDEVLIADPNRNHFEPGAAGKKLTGQERARLMFDDVCASLNTLKDLANRLP
jgi:hypothetical protein